MKYRLNFMGDTVVDRENIKIYLSKFYPGTVKRFFSLLKKRTTQLKTFPYSCPKYEDDPDYRILVVGDYLVFYIVNEETKIVEVHRIFHGSRDISQHLNQPSI